MTASTNMWAIVPAAGVGRRMGSSVPKQYLPLADSCVLQVTLNKLLGVKSINQILVAISAQDEMFQQRVQQNSRIKVIPGGDERAQSVMNGLQFLMNARSEDDWVLVHDAARPCVQVERLNQLICRVHSTQQGAILASPIADTVKGVAEHKVLKTLDRSALWLAHTPQIFKVGELYHAMEKAFADSRPITDESSAMEYAGHTPQIVEDSRDNLKITQAEDLALAEWILQKQQVSSAFNGVKDAT